MANKPQTHLDTQDLDLLDFNDTAKQMDALKAIIFNAEETNNTNIQFIKEELLVDRYQIQCKKNC